MRRRLVVAMVGVTAMSLVLAGLLSLLVAARVTRDAAERELVDQAIAIGTRAGSAATFQVLSRVAEELRFDDISRVTFAPDGSVTGNVPLGLAEADLRPDLLRAGNAVSGFKGDVVYAAAPVRGVASPADVAEPGALTAVVVTRRVESGVQRGGAWFLLAAAASLVVATGVAVALGNRFAAPVRQAQAITGRIASGDLDARVGPVRGGRELRELAHAVDTMAESLHRAKLLRRNFLLSITHDLRTPLTSINGYAEAISDGVATDPRAAASVIRSEAARLDRLVTDLLELAKLDAGQFSMQPRSVDLVPLVEGVVQGFAPIAAQSGVALEALRPTGEGADGQDDRLHTVSIDPDRFAQVLGNLIENALNYATSRVEVRIMQESSHVLVSVDDDGPGMDDGEADRVFERFYRGDRRGGRNLGSGIGLAIVKELVDAFGGSVRATVAPGGGTRMEVRVSWSKSSTTTSSSSASLSSSSPDAPSSSSPGPSS